MKTKYQKLKVRKHWGPMSPVTKVVPSKKVFNRPKEKQRFQVEYID